MEHKFPINPTWPRHQVKSSQIKEVAHDPEAERMFVHFINGSVYSYTPVSASKYKALVDSPSVGSYFHKNFKTKKGIKTNQL